MTYNDGIILWIFGMLPIFGVIFFYILKSRTGNNNNIHATIVLIAFFLLLLYTRRLTLMMPYPLNPDEAQYVAQAMLFLKHPIPWTHVDTTTGGPIGTYAILIPKMFGFSPSYFWARIVAILLIWGSCFYCFKILRVFLSNQWAFITTLAPVLFWTFPSHPDYAHYSSELVPVFLITSSLYYLTSAYQQEERFRRTLASIAIASLVPFGKLQAIVIAFPIAMTAIWYCYKNNDYRQFVRKAPFLLLAGIVFPFLILAPVVLSHGWSDFVHSYIYLAFEYGSPKFLLKSFLKNSLFRSPTAYLITVLQLSLVTLYYTISLIGKHKNHSEGKSGISIYHFVKWPFIPLIITFVASLFSIYKPGTGFPHYWQFIIIPSALISGWILSCFSNLEHYWISKMPIFALLLSFGTSRVWYSFFLFSINTNSPRECDWAGQHANDEHAINVIEYINTNKNPNDTMTVWGWLPDLYVQTGLIAGTREVCTQHIIPEADRAYPYIVFSDDYQIYFQNRFMNDIKNSNPTFIVDACYPDGFMFYDRSFSPESFPPLMSFIDNFYILTYDSSTIEQNGIRVWKKK